VADSPQDQTIDVPAEGLSIDEAADAILPFFSGLLGKEEEEEGAGDAENDDAQPESDDDEEEEIEDTDADEEESEDSDDDSDDEDLDDSDTDETEDEEEDADETDEDEDSDDTELFTVFNEDGTEKQVSRDEAKSRGLRQADYTRKTTVVATERKALETQRDSLQAERIEVAQFLQSLEAAVAGSGSEETPDWDALKKEDPAAYAVAMADHQRQQEQLRTIQTEQQRLHHEMSEAQEERKAEVIRREQALILEAIPEWSDQKVAAEQITALTAFAIERFGYTAEDMASVMDHRALLLLQDAMKLSELQESGKKVLKTKKKKSLKTLTPGGTGRTRKPKKKKSSDESKIRDASERLDKEGSRDAAVELLSSAFFGEKEK